MTYRSGPNPPQLGQPLEIRLITVAYSDGTGLDLYEIDWDEVSLVTVTLGP